MVNQQVKFAQKEVYKAGKELGSARMRLEGTEYASLSNKAMDALLKLNDKLVDDIRKG